jgi:hypothetical protein
MAEAAFDSGGASWPLCKSSPSAPAAARVCWHPQRQAEGDALSSAIGAAKVHWQRRESPRAKRTGRLRSPWERGSLAFSDFVGRRFSPPLVHLSVPPHYGRLCCTQETAPPAPAVAANARWPPLRLLRRYSRPPAPKNWAKPQGGRVGKTNRLRAAIGATNAGCASDNTCAQHIGRHVRLCKRPCLPKALVGRTRCAIVGACAATKAH